MKTIILSLFLSVMGLMGFAQAYQVTINGVVTDATSGDPMEGVMVTIETDSTPNGGSYYNVVFTSPDGAYSDTFDAEDGETGLVYTSVEDCDGSVQKVTDQYSLSNNTFQNDFSICGNPGGGGDTSCMAMYYYFPGNNPLEIRFEDQSFGNPTSWSWDFGDGEASTEQNPVHLYAQEGEYEVTLTISGDDCSSSITDFVWVKSDSTGFEECQAMYWACPDENDFMTYNFEDASWTASGNTPDSWAWDFGDGATSVEQNPTHTYAQEGQYEVCLTITDTASDCESTYCMFISVEDCGGCQAFYYYMPEDSLGYDMTTLHFFDYSMGAPDTWAWDFGDGTTSTEQNPVHTFAEEGLYNVCLTISNTSDTCDDTYCEEVYVYNDSIGDCYGFFKYYETDTAGLELNFEAQNFNNGSMDYTWDFGDGETGTGATITHTYAEGGVYLVELTATGADSSSCSWVYEEEVWVGGTNWTMNFGGKVYVDSLELADAGNVYLMVYDTTGNGLVNIDTAAIDANGYYEFETDPFQFCIYFVQAELSDQSIYFGQYLPTYHISTLSWEEAWPVFPFYPGESFDIFMIPQTSYNSGNGAVDGLVTAQGNRSVVEGVMMLLMDENGKALNYIRTSENGTYDFSELAYGTYQLRAEYVGVQSHTATFTLSEDAPAISINVTLKDGEAFLGMEEIASAYLKDFGDVYPNPVTTDASVNITMKQASKVKVTVVNQIGQVVITNVEALKSGANRVNLHTASLPQGVYIIKVTSEDGALATRKMVKVN